jgi:hypothetical protein
LNPLTHQHGAWEFEEFLLMAAGVEELRDRKVRSYISKVASELGHNQEEAHDLFAIFHQYDPTCSGCICLRELKKLLKDTGMQMVENKLTRALRHLELDSLNDFSFPEFIRIWAKMNAEFCRSLHGEHEAADSDAEFGSASPLGSPPSTNAEAGDMGLAEPVEKSPKSDRQVAFTSG